METRPLYLASVAAPHSSHTLRSRALVPAVSKAKKQSHV
jgi:hypothetical protein